MYMLFDASCTACSLSGFTWIGRDTLPRSVYVSDADNLSKINGKKW